MSNLSQRDNINDIIYEETSHNQNYELYENDNINNDNINNDTGINDIEYNIVPPSNNENIYLKYYWKILCIIAAFYILPSLQFILFQINDNSVHCYYNNKCKYYFYNIPAFNNFISNIGYILFGIIYIIYVVKNERIDKGNGIHTDNSLYICLGLSLLLEGIFSSLYHLCPSKLNFQFDTTFMFIGTLLTYLTIFQKRHPQKMPSPIKIYSALSFIVSINIISLSDIITGKDIWFWIILLLILIYGMIQSSFYMYFNKSLKINKDFFNKLISFRIKDIKLDHIPKYLFMIISNISTIIVGIVGIFNKSSFTDWMLGILTVNMIIYYVHYIVEKIYNYEMISKLWILLLLITIGILGTSTYFYLIPVSNKLLTPKESDALNKDCILFDFFDYHDIWHFLSSLGLFLLILNIYIIDKYLDNIPRNDIKIF